MVECSIEFQMNELRQEEQKHKISMVDFFFKRNYVSFQHIVYIFVYTLFA